jgi:hypothetical protein
MPAPVLVVVAAYFFLNCVIFLSWQMKARSHFLAPLFPACASCAGITGKTAFTQ